jgi:hypothetical protein
MTYLIIYLILCQSVLVYFLQYLRLFLGLVSILLAYYYSLFPDYIIYLGFRIRSLSYIPIQAHFSIYLGLGVLFLMVSV